ncbi:hypothetical protein B0H17DRAFT_1107968, partial [Mycena rosella]
GSRLDSSIVVQGPLALRQCMGNRPGRLGFLSRSRRMTSPRCTQPKCGSTFEVQSSSQGLRAR